MKMNRREFLFGAASIAAAGAYGMTKPNKTHIVTLSFDDGFRKSSLKTAEIFDLFGLKACLNVIAKSSLPRDDSAYQDAFGSFDDWNALKKRGHEIMPHTYDHQNLTQIPFDEACKLIDRCIEEFKKRLRGFDVSKAVYNVAYNASTPELERYILKSYRAVRTQGRSPINPIPKSKDRPVLGCWSDGPGNSEASLDKALNEFLDGEGGWFVWNTHGLDDEGWGPIGSEFLKTLLTRLVKLNHVDVLPAGVVLSRYAR